MLQISVRTYSNVVLSLETGFLKGFRNEWYLLEDSCSPTAPLSPKRASISSINMTEGALCLASSNAVLTSFSDSPLHLLARLLACRLMNTDLSHIFKMINIPWLWAWYYPRENVTCLLLVMVANFEAAALANIVFPVPGGPLRSTELDWLCRW